jgi:hypothetical protein
MNPLLLKFSEEYYIVKYIGNSKEKLGEEVSLC